MNDRRGQIAVLGLILLIGMVAITSVGILIYAGASTTDVKQEMENERIEGAFVELSQTMATTAATSDTTEMVEFAAGEHGTLVKSSAGTIEIDGGHINNETFDIGAIEYKGDDGTIIAYQAGGVFRETGNETQVVSAPVVHFDGDAETLTLPIMTVSNDGRIDSDTVIVSHNRTEPYRTDPIQGDTVTITVTSPYYRGWEEYFEHQAGPEAIQRVEPINDTYGVTEVELGRVEVDEIFDHAAVAVSEIDVGGAATIYGDVLTGDDEYGGEGIADGYDYTVSNTMNVEPIDDEIEAKIDTANASYDNLSEEIDANEKVTAGEYYLDEEFDTADYTWDKLSTGSNHPKEIAQLDVSGGNITLVVDGDITINDDIAVVGWEENDHEVRIYTNGRMNLNKHMCVDECEYSPGNSDNPGKSGNPGNSDNNDPEVSNVNSQQLQIYATSEFQMIWSGNNHYEGIIYAPGGSVGESGTPAIYGAVVAEKVKAQGTPEIRYDETLGDFKPRMQEGGKLPPKITYLNVVTHEVNVESS